MEADLQTHLARCKAAVITCFMSPKGRLVKTCELSGQKHKSISLIQPRMLVSTKTSRLLFGCSRLMSLISAIYAAFAPR